MDRKELARQCWLCAEQAMEDVLNPSKSRGRKIADMRYCQGMIQAYENVAWCSLGDEPQTVMIPFFGALDYVAVAFGLLHCPWGAKDPARRLQAILEWYPINGGDA